MGERELLAVGRALTLACLVLGGEAKAQGPVYRERWGYLHLEERRAAIRRELAGRDAATADRIAEILGEPDRGMPFGPVTKALAHLRAVEADAAFVLRAAIGAYVLPEVCDPEATNEICRTTNVSVFVPFAVPFPGKVSFDLAVKNAADEQVWSATLTEHTDERDVRNAQPTAQVPCSQLADGAYRVFVSTRIDGQEPRAKDPGCSWTFHVLRGYQARAERAMQQAREREASLPATDRAWVLGMAAQVTRAYFGEAFAVRSEGVRDLQRLERVLENLAEHRLVDDGVPGDACLALPVQSGLPLQCVLRRAVGASPRPLVVFVGGAPAYDVTPNRPAAPATRDPAWLAHELAAFGRAENWHVAFLESPGVGRDFAAALREALPLLGKVVATGDHKPLLVCEREAAAIVGLRIGDYRAMVGGVVLVGGGAMAAPALQANGALPVRLGAVRGLGEDSLLRVIDYVANQQAKGSWQGDVAWLSRQRPAWPFALSSFAEAIAAFAKSLYRD